MKKVGKKSEFENEILTDQENMLGTDAKIKIVSTLEEIF